MAADRSAVAAPRAAGAAADPSAGPAAGAKRMRRCPDATSSMAERSTCTCTPSRCRGADPDAAAAPAGRGEPGTPGGGRQGASGEDGAGTKGDVAGRVGDDLARLKGLEHDNRRLKNNVMLLRLQVELLRQIVHMSHQAANWDGLTGVGGSLDLDDAVVSTCPPSPVFQ